MITFPNGFNELLPKTCSLMWSPDGRVSVLDIHLQSKTPVADVLSWTCWSEDGNDQTDRLAGNATVTTRGLRLGKSKVLRNLRHYMRAQSPKGHRTTKKQQSTISFLQSLDDIRGPSPCKSDELWHRFKGHVLRKTSERRSGAAHRHGLSPQGIRHHLQLNRRSAGPSRAC